MCRSNRRTRQSDDSVTRNVLRSLAGSTMFAAVAPALTTRAPAAIAGRDAVNRQRLKKNCE